MCLHWKSKGYSLNQAANTFPGMLFFASSLNFRISESPKVIHWFNESSCLHISRMFTFLLAVIESPDSENFWRDIFQAAYFNPHFQDVDFWARHDWKFKGDIIKIICYLHISRVLTFGSSWWHRWKVKGDRFQDPKL